uniref:Ribose 5-phosphate isomerase A n=1 Tax=Ignisphaera aggregans TaxID=334771 RepID=A0A7J2U4P5_9CREN
MASEVIVARKRACEEALKRVLELKPRIMGIGTGSTVELFVEVLSKRRENLRETAYVCSSLHTCHILSEKGFTVLHLGSTTSIDVYVDGADEVDSELNMIKGGGAAATLEKILAYGSKYRIYVIDYTKLVKKLGEKHAIPVEVLPEALGIVLTRLRMLGLNISIRTLTSGKYGFVMSDTRGVIIDVKPPNWWSPRDLEKVIRSIPGVVETGLFIDLADEVFVGYPDRVEVLRKPRKNNFRAEEF